VTEIQFESVSLDIDGALAILTLDNPDRLNAISPDMAESVMRALQEASKPKHGVRALMITGKGRGFCAGADLAGRGGQAANLPVLLPAESFYHPMIRKLRDFDRPIVATVNGACVGIGVAIALQADHVIASDNAYFYTPFARLGCSPDSGLTWLLPRIVGPLRARRMLVDLERIPASLAESWGLVSQVVSADDFASATRAMADKYAAGPTMALAEMRRLIMDAQRNDFDVHMEAEARALLRTFRSKDNRVGMRAFATRTEPEFNGD